MKKIRTLLNALFASLMSVFGLTTCVPVLYGPGMPVDHLDVEGEVTNEEGEPLQSIQVVVNTANVPLGDTIYTNAAGEFDGNYYGLPQRANDTIIIEVNDTSNVYASKRLEIPYSEMDKELAGGDTEYSVDVKVQLKKK